MKYSYTWLLVMLTVFFNQAYAQQIDYNKIILPQDSHTVSITERMVQIAWMNYPANQVLQSRYRQAQEEVLQTRRSWMNNLNLVSQYNSQVNQDNQLNGFVPRLGLGLTLNVGSIINLPSNVRQAAEEINVAQANINSQKIFVRAEVLRRYNNYMLNLNLIRVQTQAVEDARSTMQLIKHRFENGEVSVEDYNKALRSFTDNSERKVVSEGNLMMAKASLEEILGITLEAAMAAER